MQSSVLISTTIIAKAKATATATTRTKIAYIFCRLEYCTSHCIANWAGGQMSRRACGLERMREGGKVEQARDRYTQRWSRGQVDRRASEKAGRQIGRVGLVGGPVSSGQAVSKAGKHLVVNC